ncbi:MAG TPA: hypothetical protein OIM43_00400 [Prevotellaceae bacterium]|nr:hypothetical protein [Prevotellaceae bacterium]
MPILNDLQKKQVIQREPTKSADYMLECIQKYNNLSLDDFPNMDSNKREYIRKKLNSIPNPNEQKEWSNIAVKLETPSQELLDALNSYILNWETSRPEGNHVDEAWNEVSRIKSLLLEEQSQKEDDDWNNVDTLSQPSLIDHLYKYPNTVHKNEIDDSVWGLVDKENIQEIQNYTTIFPSGLHANEARDILNAIVEWNNVKNTNDIFVINNYLRTNPMSPFRQQASILIAGLKQGEINAMKNNPNNYEVPRLMKLLNDGIATERELIMANVMTENILETLRTTSIESDLPDIRKAIADSHAECKDGFTDVFFFGVPSTGKTCVLMGMSRSNSLHINLASGGGDYASALQQYTDVGVTVPRTPGTFVTTLEATISSRNEPGTVHKVNLVEMSGEEFAFGIANNPNHVFTFEDMGSGATQLLKNNNHKVFFLIIDPTANVVRINREIVDGYDEETGQPLTHLEYCVVNQRTLIQKMVNLFENPGNSDIMKKVDSIHIIMTKSDTLGNPIEREEKALRIFYDKFGGDILEPLINLCREYNINSNNQFHPKLYTFSLGTFYVGGLYEYEQTDSNRLVKAIKNSTQRIKKKTFWDRLIDIVN